MRWPETRGLFTPADDRKSNVWYLRDPAAMAAAQELGVRRAVLHRAGIARAARRPAQARQAQVNLPDNHLQYAITWFGLALALAGVYVVFIAGRIAGRG